MRKTVGEIPHCTNYHHSFNIKYRYKIESIKHRIKMFTIYFYLYFMTCSLLIPNRKEFIIEK